MSIKRKQENPYKHTIAGLSAGALATVVLYPLDLVRTHYQINETSSKAYRSVARGLFTIYKDRGVQGLYRGMSPALYGATASWGLYFFFYEHAKKQCQLWFDADESNSKNIEKVNDWRSKMQINKSSQHFLSGIAAGMLCVSCTNPIWLIKVRMQVQVKASSEMAWKHSNAAMQKQTIPYKNVLHAFRTIVAEEGFLALYKGSIPALFLTTHGAFKFVAYEKLKQTYYDGVSSELNTPVSLAMGAVSQAFASTITYPYQVIKSRLQQGGEAAQQYAGTWACASKAVRREGLQGLYKGLTVNLLKVIPTGAITFAAYEKVLSLLSSD